MESKRDASELGHQLVVGGDHDARRRRLVAADEAAYPSSPFSLGAFHHNSELASKKQKRSSDRESRHDADPNKRVRRERQRRERAGQKRK